MTPERWKRVDELFAAALEHPVDQRDALLAQACAGDPELRQEVESLLSAHAEAGSALAAPGLEAAAELLIGGAPTISATQTQPADLQGISTRGSDHHSLARGATLGRYMILGPLGRGGMGVVYLAYDPELDRKVAVKLLRPDSRVAGGISEGRARLLREAQALARLAHPNVIGIYDVGTFEDQVFIAMEYIEGCTLKQWLAKSPGSWHVVLNAFIQVGRGLAAVHAASLVHRDFKPDNVLVSNDGRIRVLDFGLARVVSHPEAETQTVEIGEVSASPPRSPLDTRLTQPGLLLGTPDYMAPEQRGAAVGADARSDQYSFCTALYEALYGRLPPKQDIWVQGAASSSTRGAPAGVGRVPAWVRGVVDRGLREVPEDRYPSMDFLLNELERDPARTRRRAFAALGALVLLSLVPGTYRYTKHQQSRLCRGAEEKWVGIWDPKRREALTAAFLASGKPYAADTARYVQRKLDKYVSQWVAVRTDACEATRLRGEQSEELLDLRMACFSQRLQEVKALLEIFSQADFKTVERAANAVQEVGSPEGCMDATALRSPVQPPSDPIARGKIDELRERIAAVRAMNYSGKYSDGIRLALPLVDEAKAFHYRPVEAEALELLGQLQANGGDRRTGERSLKEALLAAEAGRHDEMAAAIQASLVSVSQQQAHYEESLEWGQRAFAAIERLGGSERVLAELFANLGMTLHRFGRFDEATENLQRSLDISRRLFGSEDPHVAHVLANMGTNFATPGKLEKALEYYREALAICERVLGPNHPDNAVVLNNIGGILTVQRKYDESLENHRRALEIREQALSSTHPYIATSLTSIATVFAAQRKFAQALEYYQRALPILEKALGPQHPQLAWMLTGLGTTELELGRHREALATLRRSAAISRPPSAAIDFADNQFALAKALATESRHSKEARKLALSARETFSAKGDKERLAAVDAWLSTTR